MLPTSSFLAVFFFSLTVSLGAVISPGPISTTIVSQAPRRGWAAGPLVATGHALLEFAMTLLLFFGLGIFLMRPEMQTGIALVGGALLFWMGTSMALGVWRGQLRLPRQDTKQQNLSGGQLISLGVAATASNPFWYAWWVTVAAGYLAQARVLGLAGVAAFYSGHILADFAWDTLLSSAIGGGRRWITERVYQVLLLICSAFFLYLAWAFLGQGLRSLL
jgi:threonine/homoserine/homoserine lactone efflux protein